MLPFFCLVSQNMFICMCAFQLFFSEAKQLIWLLLLLFSDYRNPTLELYFLCFHLFVCGIVIVHVFTHSRRV